MEKITLQEYYDKLTEFDWFYEFSDDGRVWNAGRYAYGHLKSLASTSEEHKNLFNAYQTYINNCINRVPSENNPKPKRPEEV